MLRITNRGTNFFFFFFFWLRIVWQLTSLESYFMNTINSTHFNNLHWMVVKIGVKLFVIQEFLKLK